MRNFRVPYNGIFYYIRLAGELLVLPHYDRRDTLSERLFRTGNYFTTRQGAEDAAKKVDAILQEHDKQEGGALWLNQMKHQRQGQFAIR